MDRISTSNAYGSVLSNIMAAEIRQSDAGSKVSSQNGREIVFGVRPEHIVLTNEDLFQLAQRIHFLGQQRTEVLAADFDVIPRDRHHSFLVGQGAQAPLEGHELIGDVLGANLVGALLDGRAQLSHLLFIHIWNIPDVLIEVSQLAGRSGDLNVLLGRIAAF